MIEGTMEGSARDHGAPARKEGNHRQLGGAWRRSQGSRREGATDAACRGAGVWGAVLLGLVLGLLAPPAAAEERHYSEHGDVPVLANNVSARDLVARGPGFASSPR